MNKRTVTVMQLMKKIGWSDLDIVTAASRYGDSIRGLACEQLDRLNPDMKAAYDALPEEGE